MNRLLVVALFVPPTLAVSWNAPSELFQWLGGGLGGPGLMRPGMAPGGCVGAAGLGAAPGLGCGAPGMAAGPGAWPAMGAGMATGPRPSLYAMLVQALPPDGMAMPPQVTPLSPPMAPSMMTPPASAMPCSPMMNPGMMGPGMMNPGMMSPGMIGSGMMNPGMMNPGMMNPMAPPMPPCSNLAMMPPRVPSPGLLPMGMPNPMMNPMMQGYPGMGLSPAMGGIGPCGCPACACAPNLNMEPPCAPCQPCVCSPQMSPFGIFKRKHMTVKT